MLIFPTECSLMNLLNWLHKTIRNIFLCLYMMLQMLCQCSEVSHNTFEREGRRKETQVMFMGQVASLTESIIFSSENNAGHTRNFK